MSETKLHRPIWSKPRAGSRPFCRSCGIRQGQPASHPIHYADRDERGAWAIYCARYGEWTATGLDFATADRYAKANESGSEPCGCEPQPSEDEVIDAALAALASGDPQPVLNAAASGILPTDAPVVEEARALIDRPVHCLACSSHIHHAAAPVPGCHACASAPEETPVTQTAEATQTISESLAGTINLRPTDEGFARIAERFATSLLFDIPQKRREDSRLILDSFVEIVGYLAQKDPAQVQWLRDEIMRRTR